jgi:hypothetical protein
MARSACYRVAGAGLSKHAFLQAQQVLFQQTGADEGMLRAELRIFGYDDRYAINCGHITAQSHSLF